MPPNRYGSAFVPTSRRRQNRVAGWAERCLLAVGLVALSYCGFEFGRAAYDQAQGNRDLDHLLADNVSLAKYANTTSPEGRREGALVGRIEIPRLALSAIVFEGTTEDTLGRGVGHLTGTAEPGQRGNLVLAAHRDTYFRPLRNIRAGDLINVTSPTGPSQYVVESTEIVWPEDTDVLKPIGGATMTLITCYPFQYFGNAPQRFIVRGRKVRTILPTG